MLTLYIKSQRPSRKQFITSYQQ